MKVNFYTTTQPTFGEKILSKQNKQNIKKIREKLNEFETNGVPINNNCVCKLPPDSHATLKTKDNQFSISTSIWGNNLLIRKKLADDDYNKLIISPQNDVFECLSDDDPVDIKIGSESAKRINKELAQILPIFLKQWH